MMFIMRGTTCSGKSTFIQKYFENKNAVFSSDDYREHLLGDRTSQRFNDIIFNKMHDDIEMRLSHKAAWTVYDSTNLRMKDTVAIINICKKYHCPFNIISIEPPSLEELIRRNEQRGNEIGFYIPEPVLEKHLHRYTASFDPFIQEAFHNPLCSLVEIDQNEEVIREVK